MARAKRRRCNREPIDPEPWKTLVALLYFVAATGVTSIVMVIVHDRVPDMLVFPPLPGKLAFLKPAPTSCRLPTN